jgi:phosphohistidine phosphatase SixA
LSRPDVISVRTVQPGERSFLWRACVVTAAAALGVSALAPRPSLAQGQALQPQLAGRELVEALAEGGYVILMRHAATDRFVADPDQFDLADCATQRNLSEEGRRQATLIGRSFEKLGIEVSRVLTSPYCRCVDTAKLAFGRLEKSEALAAVDDLTYPERDARGMQIRQMLGTAPAAGTNTVLITHTGNLLYSFGLQARPEGIAHVFRPAEIGPAPYVGTMLPDEWPALAGIASGTP